MDIVTRDAVRQVLLSWQAGHLAANDVHRWASDRYPGGAPKDDLVVEILARLDMLDLNLMTPDDIPVLVQALDLPRARMAEAISLLEHYDTAVDIDNRKRALASDPFYARFCT